MHAISHTPPGNTVRVRSEPAPTVVDHGYDDRHPTTMCAPSRLIDRYRNTPPPTAENPCAEAIRRLYCARGDRAMLELCHWLVGRAFEYADELLANAHYQNYLLAHSAFLCATEGEHVDRAQLAIESSGYVLDSARRRDIEDYEITQQLEWIERKIDG